MNQGLLLSMLLGIPALVAGLTLHEFAHAWTADKLGDDTPRRLGRLTLDPMRHLDPFGSLMYVLSSLAGFGFGWAKPVPFNARNFSNPRRDSVLVAIAGPISNLLQVPIWMLALRLFTAATDSMNAVSGSGVGGMIGLVQLMLIMGIVLNVILAVFNMIPIPPLDGHYVLEGLGPPFITDFYNMIRPYSFLVLLLALNIPGDPLGKVLSPAMGLAYQAVGWALGSSRAF